MNVAKVEEGVSRSGDGTSTLILPAIKWSYTKQSQKMAAIHVHLPSAWSSSNMSEIKLTSENKVVEINFSQSRIFMKKDRLLKGEKNLQVVMSRPKHLCKKSTIFTSRNW